MLNMTGVKNKTFYNISTFLIREPEIMSFTTIHIDSQYVHNGKFGYTLTVPASFPPSEGSSPYHLTESKMRSQCISP